MSRRRLVLALAAVLIVADPRPVWSQGLAVVFDTLWVTVRDSLYDGEVSRRFLSDSAYARLKRQTADAEDLDDLARRFNAFLASLHVSHTQLFTRSDLEYSLLRTMGMRMIDEPRAPQIGAQFRERDGRYVVRCVWDGGPAASTGLRRGDIVLGADGVAFHPLRSFRDGNRSLLHVQRGRRSFHLPVVPVRQSTHAAVVAATSNSVRWLSTEGRRIGYVHLWTGTGPAALDGFRSIVLDTLAGADGIILDLRDGFGGAWYDFLDPFFRDRSGFFRTTVLTRARASLVDTAAAIPPHPCFSGPMVVLVNEGTRSGMEAMAYQFAKSRRATLVGVTTAGALAGGMSFFADDDHEYLLTVAVHGLLLDGHAIEGSGVIPDRKVDYPLESALDRDPQFEAAVAEMRRLLAAR